MSRCWPTEESETVWERTLRQEDSANKGNAGRSGKKSTMLCKHFLEKQLVASWMSGVEGHGLAEKPWDTVVRSDTFKWGNGVGREITPGGYVEGRPEDHEVGGRETGLEAVVILQVKDWELEPQLWEHRASRKRRLENHLQDRMQGLMNDEMWKQWDKGRFQKRLAAHWSIL